MEVFLTPAMLEETLDRARVDEATVEEVLEVFVSPANPALLAWMLRLRNDVYCVIFVCGRSATTCYVPELAMARKRVPPLCTQEVGYMAGLNQWLISCREAQPGVTPKKAKRR